jgi:hypothetical protein
MSVSRVASFRADSGHLFLRQDVDDTALAYVITSKYRDVAQGVVR